MLQPSSFTIKIKQQPDRGRRSAFSEVLSGSLLSPCLIIQLDTNEPLHERVCVSKVTLYAADSSNSKAIVMAPCRANSRQTENTVNDFPYQALIGQTVTTGTIFKDPDTGMETMLFIFQQLSVRTRGESRLHCQVTDMTRYFVLISMTLDTESIFTDIIRIYSPAQFPGQDSPTNLVLGLAAQGLKLLNRNYKRK
jgi:hypothetical protein